MDPVEITAGRLHLRPWQAGDEDVLREAASDLAVQRENGSGMSGVGEHAREYLAGAEGWASGSAPTWAVCDSTSGQVLAHVGLRRRCDEDVWEVSAWCRPSSRGQGVVPQAVGAACRWAFAELGAARMEWRAEVGDRASRRAAEKAGFCGEGVLRRGLRQRGEHVDAWLAALLPDDPVRDTAALPPLGRPTDGVVALRRPQEHDLPAIARACADTETARWLPVPVPYTLADARAWALGIVPREWADGTAASVAVVDAVTDELLGAVGLTLGRAGVAEVGYWTAPHARGRGTAVRAARLHAAWGVEALGLARVELLTDVRNLASQRVATRAGFVREGVARAVRPAPRSTDRVDMLVWASVPA